MIAELIVALIIGFLFGALTAWFYSKKRAAAAVAAEVASQLTAQQASVQAANFAHTQELQELSFMHKQELASLELAHTEKLSALELKHAETAAANSNAHATALSEIQSELAASKAEAEQLRQQNQTLREQLTALNTQQQQDNQVLKHLAPVAKSLEALSTKVATLEEQRAAQHGELVGQLQKATVAEQQLLHTSQQLAQALTATSGRGKWGESTLKRLFEETGMTDHIDFSSQTSLSTAEGSRQRPDYIVHLAGNRMLAIDAKAPLASLLQLDPGADPETVKEAQKTHALALKKHIKDLHDRNYQASLGESLDMVLAFVPNDALLSHAFAADPNLHDYGYSMKVALVSPATLYATLKAAEYGWRQQALSAEAKQLHALSTELYKRLTTMAERLGKLGGSIKRSVQEYNALISSVESRLLPTARKVSAIDPTLLAPAVSELPQKRLDEAPKNITAPELSAASSDAAIDAPEL